VNGLVQYNWLFSATFVSPPGIISRGRHIAALYWRFREILYRLYSDLRFVPFNHLEEEFDIVLYQVAFLRLLVSIYRCLCSFEVLLCLAHVGFIPADHLLYVC
jgi:hypothetical protein